jgi:hypothetical protein
MVSRYPGGYAVPRCTSGMGVSPIDELSVVAAPKGYAAATWPCSDHFCGQQVAPPSTNHFVPVHVFTSCRAVWQPWLGRNPWERALKRGS